MIERELFNIAFFMGKALFFILICIGAPLKAQVYYEEPSQPDPTDFSFPKGVILKFAPMSLADLTPSVQGGVEYRVFENISLQHELGYISQGVLIHSSKEVENERGFRFRNEVRVYLSHNPRTNSYSYLAPEVFFINTTGDRTDSFWRNCTGWECEYVQELDYNIHRRVLGFHFKMGKVWFVNDRLVFDVYYGGGLRRVNRFASGIPENSRRQRLMGNDFEENLDTIRPSISLGFKIGLLLSR